MPIFQGNSRFPALWADFWRTTLLSAWPDLPNLRELKSQPESCNLIIYINELKSFWTGYANLRRLDNSWWALTVVTLAFDARACDG